MENTPVVEEDYVTLLVPNSAHCGLCSKMYRIKGHGLDPRKIRDSARAESVGGSDQRTPAEHHFGLSRFPEKHDLALIVFILVIWRSEDHDKLISVSQGRYKRPPWQLAGKIVLYLLNGQLGRPSSRSKSGSEAASLL